MSYKPMWPNGQATIPASDLDSEVSTPSIISIHLGLLYSLPLVALALLWDGDDQYLSILLISKAKQNLYLFRLLMLLLILLALWCFWLSLSLCLALTFWQSFNT